MRKIMKDYCVAVDLETLDIKKDSLVLTVGLVKFDKNSMDEPFDGVHIRLGIQEQRDKGRTISKGTVEWWARQTPEIREDAFGNEGRVSVKEGIEQIIEYFQVMDSSDHNQGYIKINEVWGQGYGFDMTILGTLFELYGYEVPWKFFEERDSRTLFKLVSKDPRPEEASATLHNALSDAYFQAIGIQRVFNTLRKHDIVLD